MSSDLLVTWTNSTSSTSSTIDLALLRDAAGILAQRNSTNAQTFRVYNTYTSSTSFETLQIQNVASTGVRIGYAIGSAGGTGGASRQLDFGRWNAASAWTSLLTWNADDFASFSGNVIITDTSNYSAFRHLNSSFGCFGDGAGFAIASNLYQAIPTYNTGTNRSSWSANSGRLASIFSATHTALASTSFYDWRYLPTGTGVTSYSLMKLAFDGTFTLTQPVSTSGSPTGFTWTGGAHTTLALSTEATDVNFNLARTVQFATGAITTQRAMRIQAPTYSFVGASTITTASTLSISGAPVAGTNATITTSLALEIESGSMWLRGTGGITATNSGNFVSLTADRFRYSTSGGVGYWAMDSAGLTIGRGLPLSFGSGNTNITAGGTGDVFLHPEAAATLSLRNSTNAQTFRLYRTWTSTTSYERLNIKGVASANFEIGPENGSAGGTLRGFTIGGYSAGTTTIAPWLTFTSAGNATFSQYATIQGGVLVEAGGSFTTNYAAPAQVRVRRAQGTQASPTQVTTGVQLGIIGAQGLNDIGTYAGYAGYISFNAAENITSTGCGGYFNFYTTPVGSTTEVMRAWIGAAGNFGIGVFAAEPSTLLTINGDMLRLMTAKTPATSGATGNAGEICWDTTYLYCCTATNTWKRIAWTTF